MTSLKSRPSRRSLIKVVGGLAVMAGVGLVVGSADARPPRVWRPPPSPRFSAHLESASGRALQTFSHRGQTFVLGDNGDRYSIVVSNPTAQRVEAVVTVDGRDVINGRRGDFVRNRGYVVPAFGTTRIDGFRQSLDHVAAFRFGDPESSYSAQMGTPQNVGVIGVAIFRERAEREPVIIERPSAAAQPRPKRAAPGRSSRSTDSARPGGLGTQWGEDRFSQVSQTRFVRISNTPSQVILMRYDDAEGLQARGIDVFPRPWRPSPPVVSPQAFPDSRFAPPPPDFAPPPRR